MAGGTGLDDFDFNALNETGKTATTLDFITDFKRGLDDLDLRTIDAKTGTAVNDAFKFVGTAAFSNTKGEVRFFQENPGGTANDKTIIEGDITGDGKADFQIELTGLKTLTGSDFFL